MKLTYLDNETIKFDYDTNIEYRGIKKWFDRYVDGYMFDPRFKNKLWDGKTSCYNDTEHTIPLGLWQEAFRCAQEFGYPIEFTNKKEFPLNRKLKLEDFEEFVKTHFSTYKFMPRDYQIRAAFNVIKNRYCNISVATSGGKTLIYSMVLMYLRYKNPNAKFLLIVPSKTLVTQFYDDLLDFMQGKFNWSIEEIFDQTEKPRKSHPDCPGDIYIGTFQSLTDKDKYPTKWFKQFYCVTADEGHKSKSKSYRALFKKTIGTATYRWGMSGSFPDIDSYEMMEIMAKTGPVVDVVKARELMDKGFITPVKIKVIKMLHNDWEFRELIEIVGARDKKSCYDLECEKLQESQERLDLISSLVKKCKSNTLVLFHNTEYGQKIFERLKDDNPDKEFYYIDGSVKNNATKKNIENNRNFIKAEMEKTDKVRVLVASFGTLSTGVSINAITNVIFTQSFKKEQVIIQSIGRALRLHAEKKKAYIFDLVDVFNYDEFAERIKRARPFKNILHTHMDKRCKIYIDEEYPFDIIEVNLKPV